jgi:hypothetical protein
VLIFDPAFALFGFGRRRHRPPVAHLAHRIHVLLCSIHSLRQNSVSRSTPLFSFNSEFAAGSRAPLRYCDPDRRSRAHRHDEPDARARAVRP